MADIKISDLSVGAALGDTDLIECVQSGVNKKVSPAMIKAYLAQPLQYRARITQSGTGAPTAVVHGNTTGATVTWARSGAGYSSATFSSAVASTTKTNVQVTGRGSGGYTDPKLFTHQQASTTVINFGAFRASDQTAEDDWVMDVIISIDL